MGLAASQARLLTITSRKSDCEFQSMRYSHQKIALSRDLTDISNEYQNSLNATKMVYDFYGTGDESTALSYSLLMTPSELNTYMPILTTDTSGRVVLDSKYAAAAEAAGIPKEGLGCQPSSTVRNKFLEGLKDQGIISETQYNSYKDITYLQNYGVGSKNYIISEETATLTLSQMLENYFKSGNAEYLTLDANAIKNAFGATGDWTNVEIRNGSVKDSGNNSKTVNGDVVSIEEILKGDYRILSQLNANGENQENALKSVAELDIIEQIFGEIDKIIGVSDNAKSAIAEARSSINHWLNSDNYTLVEGLTKENGHNGYDGVINCMDNENLDSGGYIWGLFGIGGYMQTSFNTMSNLKTSLYYNVKGVWGKEKDGAKYADGIGVNISNLAKMYMTYILSYMETLEYGSSEYNVDSGENSKQRTENDKWVNFDEDKDKCFTITTQQGVNTDQSLMSAAYDAIFNQICLRGWSENNNVTDKDYLQNMYKNGQLFLCKCFDDGYYYQENYGTDTYIKEVTDDEAIAKAEAKYNTEKQKINHKEEVLDLKMKNLDAEISSLTTEYDSVKSVISKNVERSFKRYDA